MKICNLGQSGNADYLPVEVSVDTGKDKYPRLMEHLESQIRKRTQALEESLENLRKSHEEKVEQIDRLKHDLDYEYAKKEGPELLRESIQGTERTKSIVIALQGYARNPDMEVIYPLKAH